MNIRVMTFNIRYDTEGDGINAFAGRKEFIREFLLREKPDVIGFQEALPHVRDFLRDALTGYTVLGAGRRADYSDEGVPVAYRNDKFDLLSYETFWLSDTPDKPGSFYTIDQSPCPRLTVMATLIDRESGKPFVFANTHLDHYGEFARVCGASLTIGKIVEKGLPFLLTGDFNATPDSKAIQTIKNVKGVKELTAGVPKSFATYHGYGKITKNCKIDYIFSNGRAVKDSLVIHTDKRADGVYLSDHYPISVIAAL